MSNIPFPHPVIIAGRTFWSKGDLRAWVAEMKGEAASAARPDDEHLMAAKAVREMLGGVSAMWLWRRRRDATLRKLASSLTGDVTKKLTELRKLNDASRGLSDRHLRRVIKAGEAALT